jgi:hypothetical protein
MMTLWMVPIPMFLRNSVGDGTILVAGCIAAGIGLALGRATADKSNGVKLVAFLVSLVLISTVAVLVSQQKA